MSSLLIDPRYLTLISNLTTKETIGQSGFSDSTFSHKYRNFIRQIRTKWREWIWIITPRDEDWELEYIPVGSKEIIWYQRKIRFGQDNDCWDLTVLREEQISIEKSWLKVWLRDRSNNNDRIDIGSDRLLSPHTEWISVAISFHPTECMRLLIYPYICSITNTDMISDHMSTYNWFDFECVSWALRKQNKYLTIWTLDDPGDYPKCLLWVPWEKSDTMFWEDNLDSPSLRWWDRRSS